MGVREKGGLVWSGTISACCGSRLLAGAVDGHQHWPHLAHSSAPSPFRSQLIRWPLRANLASELIGLFPSPWKNKPECCVGILGSCCRIYYLTVLKVKFEMDQQGCVPSPTAQLRVERGQGLVEQELGRRYNGAEAKTEDN